MNEGEVARELRELPDPLNDGPDDLRDLEDVVELAPFRLLSRAAGPDHSLSVGAELAESSRSPILLPRPPLVEADPETKLKVEEFALMSFSFSFSSKPMKILDRASLYAASRSSIVLNLFAAALAWLLRPLILPASDASTSDVSASSPAVEPGWEYWRPRGRLMIWIAGCADSSAGTSSQIRRMGLQATYIEQRITRRIATITYIRLSER